MSHYVAMNPFVKFASARRPAGRSIHRQNGDCRLRHRVIDLGDSDVSRRIANRMGGTWETGAGDALWRTLRWGASSIAMWLLRIADSRCR
jgi:hypothetical protein